MARARNIKPGFFKNEDLAECSAFARLCFAGLWTMADREGRLEDRPKRIKGELFAYDSVEVEPLLEELAKWGFIRRYQIGGERFIFIVKFVEHQAPHGTEKDGLIPDEAGMVTVNERAKNGYITGKFRLEPHPLTVKCIGQSETLGPTDNRNLTVVGWSAEGGKNALIPDSGFLIPDSLNLCPPPEGQPSAEPTSPGFERFWSAWPKGGRKGARGKCFEAWKKARAEPLWPVIVAHVEFRKTTDDWRKQNGQFIEAPLAYLNGRKWEGAELDTQGDQIDDVYRGVR